MPVTVGPSPEKSSPRLRGLAIASHSVAKPGLSTRMRMHAKAIAQSMFQPLWFRTYECIWKWRRSHSYWPGSLDPVLLGQRMARSVFARTPSHPRSCARGLDNTSMKHSVLYGWISEGRVARSGKGKSATGESMSATGSLCFRGLNQPFSASGFPIGAQPPTRTFLGSFSGPPALSSLLLPRLHLRPPRPLCRGDLPAGRR